MNDLGTIPGPLTGTAPFQYTDPQLRIGSTQNPGLDLIGFVPPLNSITEELRMIVTFRIDTSLDVHCEPEICPEGMPSQIFYAPKRTGVEANDIRSQDQAPHWNFQHVQRYYRAGTTFSNTPIYDAPMWGAQRLVNNMAPGGNSGMDPTMNQYNSNDIGTLNKNAGSLFESLTHQEKAQVESGEKQLSDFDMPSPATAAKRARL